MELSIGTASSHIIDNEKNQLTVDFAFDSLYFKINNCDWIEISFNPSYLRNDIHLIDTPEKIKIFKNLCSYALNNLPKYNKDNKLLFNLMKLYDLFV